MTDETKRLEFDEMAFASEMRKYQQVESDDIQPHRAIELGRWQFDRDKTIHSAAEAKISQLEVTCNALMMIGEHLTKALLQISSSRPEMAHDIALEALSKKFTEGGK